MTSIVIEPVSSEKDLAKLVELNCKDIDEWRHYDKTCQPGRPAAWSELSRWERWQHGGPWLDPDLLEFHLHMIKETNGSVLVARKDEVIIGELDLVFESEAHQDNRGHIVWMIVDSDHRRKDIGTLLLEQGLQIAEHHSCQYITSYPEDDFSNAFYLAQGFRATRKIAEYTKQVEPASNQGKNSDVQIIPLEWKTRKRPPQGFSLTIGNNYAPTYVWTYLRKMDQLYSLMDSDAPRPHLWLLRKDEAEAITMDHGIVRLWISQLDNKEPNFLNVALQDTECLSRSNQVTSLVAYAFPTESGVLKNDGFILQREYPFLTLRL